MVTFHDRSLSLPSHSTPYMQVAFSYDPPVSTALPSFMPSQAWVRDRIRTEVLLHVLDAMGIIEWVVA